jgi:hypothetical protein
VIEMSKWERFEADVIDDLQLDPRNVRLGTDVTAPEADIMADLFRNEKALDLVEGITKVGYLTHEVPIVLRRSRHRMLIVAEGNRRVAALKAIQNPYLVPEFAARIAAMAGLLDDRAVLRKIEVIRAPNQDAADQVIAALHTGDTRVKWNPARQTAFFEAQLEQGKKLGQLKLQYPTIDVEKYVLRSGFMSLLKSVPYAVAAHRDLLLGRANVTSTLERIYESKPFIDLTGLSMDSDGQVTHGLTDDVFAEMAELIMSGISDGDINTRTIGRVTDVRYQKLIADLTTIKEGGSAGEVASSGGPSGGSTAANGSSAGSGSSARSDGARSNGGQTAGSSASDGSAGASGESSAGAGTSSSAGANGDGAATRRRRASKTLDVTGLKVPDNYPDAVKVLLTELSALDVVRFPNATFDVMRTFLEKSIKARAELRGVDLRRNGIKGYVYLKSCLEWMQQDVETNGPRALVQVLKGMQSSKVLDYVGSGDHLNALNHNHHVCVSESEVRHSWGMMKSVLTEVFK